MTHQVRNEKAARGAFAKRKPDDARRTLLPCSIRLTRLTAKRSIWLILNDKEYVNLASTTTSSNEKEKLKSLLYVRVLAHLHICLLAVCMFVCVGLYIEH
jgi:hypothetical protein